MSSYDETNSPFPIPECTSSLLPHHHRQHIARLRSSVNDLKRKASELSNKSNVSAAEILEARLKHVASDVELYAAMFNGMKATFTAGQVSGTAMEDVKKQARQILTKKRKTAATLATLQCNKESVLEQMAGESTMKQRSIKNRDMIRAYEAIVVNSFRHVSDLPASLSRSKKKHDT